ncbi:sensor histidine kinase [Paenibacillus sp. sgz500958]|uniref:sensor histidine kinase n=1 Tax=Paenibacillus sp. sgz500958 TaxID=3242475 RepID=UPI0036D2BDEA
MKHPMKSLYVRMCFVFCSVIVFSGLFAFLGSNFYYQIKVKPQNDAKLTGMALQLQEFSKSYPETTDDYLSSSAALGYKLYVTDGQGDERYYGTPFREKNLDSDVIRNVLQGEVYHGVAEFPRQLFVTGFFDNELRNSIGVSIVMNNRTYALFLRPDAEVQFGELRIFFAMILGLSLLFSLWFVMVSVLHVVKPITRLTAATKSISKGRYDIKLNTRRKDEIGQLASHFMIMSRELEQTNRARAEFVANVSHEIESPLTSIQGFAHSLKNPGLADEERDQYLSIIEEESRRLSLLSKQLLTLSSLDHEGKLLQITSFDLRTQLRQVAQIMEWKLAGKQLSLRLNVPEISLRGDVNLLHQVWMNLVSNAVKYTAEGGEVTVSANMEGANCIIRVSDTGEGISPEDLPRIFDRFYRADRARTRDTHSTGLGLSIAFKIVTAHEGTLEVESELGKGTTFTVTLPGL